MRPSRAKWAYSWYSNRMAQESNPHYASCTTIFQPPTPPLITRFRLLNDEELNTDDPLLGASVAQTQVALNPATIDYLVQSLGVSPIFLSTITTVPWLLDTGNALFKTYDSDIHHPSNISSIRKHRQPSPREDIVLMRGTEGFFRLSDRGRPSHVWFKHDIVSKSTTYIIQGCPQRVVDVLYQWTEDEMLRKHLLRPLALESLLVDEVTWAWSKGVVDNARKLLEYVSGGCGSGLARDSLGSFRSISTRRTTPTVLTRQSTPCIIYLNTFTSYRKS